MNKYTNKRIFIIVSAILVTIAMIISVNASQSSQGWYCIRNKNHKQPILDSNLSIIEYYGGFSVDKAHGDDCNDKVVYLTFDAGYENGNIARILDVLKEENVKGAFFVLGNLIKKDTSLVLRMFEEGHLVCNHTYSHKSMVNVSFDDFNAELSKLEDTCAEYTGYELSKYYRPPEGRFDEESLEYAQKLGYKTVFWSIAYDDWDNNRQMDRSRAMAKIMDNIHNGAIILLHPTSKTNADMMSDLIKNLKKQGYRFGTLDEIVGC